MRKKILIYIGRVLAILVILTSIFFGVIFYCFHKAVTFWDAAKNFDITKLEELIHKEGYSPDTKVPGFHPTAITFLSCASNKNVDQAYATIKYLLEQGANPDSKNERGTGNLAVAITCHQPKLVKLLVEYGADINAILMPYGSGYFYAAILTKQYDLAQYLLDHGAYTDQKLYQFFKEKQKEASLKKTK